MNLTLQSAAVGTIAIGIVLVLLLGEIDLSVGSVSGLAAAILGVGLTLHHWPLGLALLAAILAGTVVGLAYGAIFTRFGVPSFVITLAGLLGFLGLQLYVLGKEGSINIPFDSPIVEFAQQQFLAPVGGLRAAWCSSPVAYPREPAARPRDAARPRGCRRRRS